MKTRRIFRHWPADRWFALVALVTSVCSLSVSINQCENSRLHDQPRLEYVFYFDETGSGWRILNSGLGPARLRGFEMTVYGKPQDSLDALFQSLGMPSTDVRFTNPRVGDLYKAGMSGVLFWVPPGPSSQALQSVWRRVNIVACYCSIHDECWRFDMSAVPTPYGDPRDDSCSTFKGQEYDRWWQG